MASIRMKAPSGGANVEGEKAAKFLGVSTDCLTRAAESCPWLNRRKHGNKVLYSTKAITLLAEMLEVGAISWEIFSRKNEAAQERPGKPGKAQRGPETQGEETA